jgi:hypothetical protein
VVSLALFVFVLFVPLVVKKELRGEGELYGGQALQIGGCDGDLPAEARVLADVFQLGGVLRVGVQQGLDPPPIGQRPIVIFLGPDRGPLHDERFAIGIEFVGHGIGDWGLGAGDWKKLISPRHLKRIVMSHSAAGLSGRPIRQYTGGLTAGKWVESEEWSR